MTAPLEEPEMTELYDADIPRVDLVRNAANGTKVLLAKSTNGLIAPEQVRELIAKADGTDLTEALDTSEAGAEAAIPGSRDWEAVDSASAKKWIGVLTRAKHAVALLAEREVIESVTVDSADICASWDLEDAVWAIDSAIARLAVYAAGEDGEVMAADDAAIAKAADAIPADALAEVESTAPLFKAGRALSAANETKLRNAAEQIQQVLAALPAPEPVEKEATVAETPEAPAAAEAPEAPVVKADSLTAVYDATGKLVGVVAPDAITAVDGGAEAAEDAAEEETAEDGEEATVEEAAADADDEAERNIPGTQTVQSPVEKTAEPNEVVTVTATPDIAEVLKEALEPLAEKLAKAAELAETVEVLKEQIRKFGQQPDDRRSPLLNGATGTPGVAQRDGSETVEDPYADLRKAASEARTQGDVIKANKDLALAQLKDALSGSAGSRHFQNVAARFTD